MKHTLSILSLVIGVAFTGQASADWKGYAGLNCLSHSPSNDVRRSTSGTVNWQDSATIIYCPVVRDIATGGADRIERVNVRLYDNNANEDGWCRLVNRTISGGIGDWAHQTWSGTGDFTITFENLDTTNWGNIALYCSIPGTDGARKSFIRSYAVEEQ